MNVLCVAAHPDDEVLGAGGAISRHSDEQRNVHVCILSDGVTSRYDDGDTTEAEVEQRRDNARRACAILGVSVSFHDFPDNNFDAVPLLDIVKTIEAEVREHEPSLVYTHHYGDLNIDHELTCRATVTATRPLEGSSVNRVLAFETLSASEWAVPAPDTPFQPTSFVDISRHLEVKLEALSAYEEELRQPPHPRSVDTVRRNARVWGAKAGFEAAEPFEVLREQVPYS